MDQIQFTFPEILSIIGVTQCVYIIVYMLMRAGRLSHAGLPIAYFTFLALAFFSDFSYRIISPVFPAHYYLQWAFWFMGPPLSVLMIIQIAQIAHVPALRHFWVLLLVPLAFVASVVATPSCRFMDACSDRAEWLTVLGIIAGSLSLLAIWGQRGLFTAITQEKTGKSRYWLILALIFMNMFFLVIMLASLSVPESGLQFVLVRTVMGLGFVYLVGTSLFRIYPQVVRLSSNNDSFSSADIEIVKKIENLLTLQKVYHEPSYSRTDLAREVGASEPVVSRIINLHFRKTFPQIMNEYRISDAKRLLLETNANVRTVAGEVGFNSLATFNRVFKDMTGTTPAQFRETRAA